MTLFHALLFGVIEGVSEFLPISSTAHLILAADLLQLQQTEFQKTFEVVIQLGAILSVLVLYWRSFLVDRATLMTPAATNGKFLSALEGAAAYAVEQFGGNTELLWHGEDTIKNVDAVVVPGGFAHGDYLRPGAIARFSPVMAAVADFAAAGGPVVGICNGFQVLTEAGLLPGALQKNEGLTFICDTATLRVETARTAVSALSAIPTALSVTAARSADLVSSIWSTDLVVVPVGSDGVLSLLVGSICAVYLGPLVAPILEPVIGKLAPGRSEQIGCGFPVCPGAIDPMQDSFAEAAADIAAQVERTFENGRFLLTAVDLWLGDVAEQLLHRTGRFATQQTRFSGGVIG